MGYRGPLKDPWRGPGAEPRRGSRGQCPWKLLGFNICKRPGKALLEICFSLNQPTSAWYRNVSIKWHTSLKFKSQNHELFWTILKNGLIILKQIAWESSKMHSNFIGSLFLELLIETAKYCLYVLSNTLQIFLVWKGRGLRAMCPLRRYENFANFKPNLRDLMHTFR